jgi:hypothetical protein
MKLDREDLYQRVWSTPMTKLAKELDISDVGLAKACRKAGIPLPPVGYWAKVAHGKPVPRPALPPSDQKTIEIDAQRFRGANPAPAETTQVAPTVSVPVEMPSRLPPFTAATKAQLVKARPKGAAFAVSSGTSTFDCRVGMDSVERTLRVLAAVESNLSVISATLVPGKQRLEVEVEGQRLEFRIVEQTKRTEIVVKDKYYKGSVSKDYEYAFSGLLNIEVLSYYEGRKKWTDGKRAPLTEKIGDFLQGLVDGALSMRRREEELEAQHRRWAEEARHREEQAARRKALQELQQRLVEEAIAADQSRRVLDYVQQLRGRLDATGQGTPEDSQRWLELAEKLARSLDPTLRRVQVLQQGKGLEPYPGCFENSGQL